jgi:hypothetical protein
MEGGMTSVGSIVGGAFGLVRRHPLSVFVWGLLYMAVVVALGFAMRPLFQVYSEMFGQILANGAGKPLPPEALQPYIARMQAAGGIVFLAEIAMFAVLMAVFTATQRAVLRPAERGFAFLRLGMDELRMIGVGLILAIGLSVGMFVAMLALMIVVGIVFAITMAATGSPVIGVLLFALAYVVLIGAMIYAEVRFSLAFPLTFMRREFAIGEAWRLTKGRFWTLFGAYFTIGLVYMILAAILFTIGFGAFFSEVAQSRNSPEVVQIAFQNQMALFSSFNAVSVSLLVGGTLLGGLTMALFGGAIATAARDLAPDPQGDTAPFA